MTLQVLEIFRQGDILFKRVESIDDMDKKEIQGSLTVALGELTGHHHSFVQGSLVQLYSDPKDSTNTPIAMKIMSRKEIAKVKGEMDQASKSGSGGGGMFGIGSGGSSGGGSSSSSSSSMATQELIQPTAAPSEKQEAEIVDAQQLVHNEHSSLLLPPGQYVIGREKEYNYWTKELVKTRD
jgi:hypothetical protein